MCRHCLIETCKGMCTCASLELGKAGLSARTTDTDTED